MRDREVSFADFVEVKSISDVWDDPTPGFGKPLSNMPINYNIGRYSLRRSQRRSSHGDELKWRAQWISDDDPRRVELLARLRDRQRRLKAVRDGSADYDRKDLTDMLKTADMRPQLYRHYLLRNFSAGKEPVTPQTEWAAAIQEAAVERAKSDFHGAYNDSDGRVPEIGGSHIEPTCTTGKIPIVLQCDRALDS